ncbi:hypothetical protein Hanom_Chr10g00928051 [Helianthus anomalus]
MVLHLEKHGFQLVIFFFLNNFFLFKKNTGSTRGWGMGDLVECCRSKRFLAEAGVEKILGGDMLGQFLELTNAMYQSIHFGS